MNILINTNALRNALHDIVGVVSKDLSMPILSHVLIEKNKNQINITGTNLEMQITAKADFLEADEFDPITVSGRKLYEIVRSLNDQNIQITTTCPSALGNNGATNSIANESMDFDNISSQSCNPVGRP